MKTSLVVLALLALSFTAPHASASCEVISPPLSPDINYTTVCVLDEGSYDDSIQTFSHDYLLHVSHAVELDPAFDYMFLYADQGAWTYDDGEVYHERTWTSIGGNTFWGVRGLVGAGLHGRLDQRDQTAAEDGWGACSGIIGQSTCFGAGGWVTVQDVGGAGIGVYYQQSGSGDSCQEQAEIDVSAGILFVPVITPAGPCTAELPMLYDEIPFRDVTSLA